MDQTATLLSWNVAGKLRRLDEQAHIVCRLDADLICLQEISASSAPRWTDWLTRSRWPHVVVARPHAQPVSRRPLCVLVAARGPLTEEPIPDLPWPERVLAVATKGLHVVNVHSPISPSPALAKVLTHEAVHQYLRPGSGPRIVCGDLNTPRREHPDGRVWTFARNRNGRLRAERGERWDDAELALIKGLEPYGFRDAFRDVHGLERRELSWEWQRSGGGYRLDHLIVSAEVTVDSVTYLHEWRHAGLSDHSPLYAKIGWERSERA